MHVNDALVEPTHRLSEHPPVPAQRVPANHRMLRWEFVSGALEALVSPLPAGSAVASQRRGLVRRSRCSFPSAAAILGLLSVLPLVLEGRPSWSREGRASSVGTPQTGALTSFILDTLGLREAENPGDIVERRRKGARSSLLSATPPALSDCPSGEALDRCGVCGGNNSSCLALHTVGAARATMCVGDGMLGRFAFEAPAERDLAVLVLQSTIGGSYREVLFEPGSSQCGRCEDCFASGDSPPRCLRSGCAGCAIQGEILLDDAAIPLPAEAGTYRLFIATFVGSVETRRAELAVDIRGPRDECGVCGGGGASCMGCDGQINSGAVFDRCGKCAVPGTADFNACVDCSGEVDGVDSEDICGVCGGDGTSCLDCFDTPFGTARPDSCGECGGNDATCIGSYSLEAVLSSKGLCAGDKVAVRVAVPSNHSGEDVVALFRADIPVPLAPDVPVPPGNTADLVFQTQARWLEGPPADGRVQLRFAYLRGPRPPNGWDYGRTEASSQAVTLGGVVDACGVCGGDNSSCAGCDGVPNSGVAHDRCGECGGADACLDCAEEPFGGRQLDRCGSCLMPVRVCVGGDSDGARCIEAHECGGGGSCVPTPERRGDWNKCVDCRGKVDGGAREDSCGTCEGSDDSCNRNFSVALAHAELCLGEALVAHWQGPSNRDPGAMLVLCRDTIDGCGAPLGWAHLDPSGGKRESFWAALPPGERASPLVLVGEVAYLVDGDRRGGVVLLNRSAAAEQPPECMQPPAACLEPNELARPLHEGTYRLQILVNTSQPELQRRAAESAPVTVLPPADACGVCGGDNSSCAGCDRVPNSGTTFDLCGVCGGTDACVGCDGVPNSGKVKDLCGVCDGHDSSCRGCDGIVRPNGPVREDACGTCGGDDDSCGRPPRLGLAPSWLGVACAGQDGELTALDVWWEAPSNRSAVDYIAVCHTNSLIESCPVLLEGPAFSGARGRVNAKLPTLFAREHDDLEVRYISRRDAAEDEVKWVTVVKASFTVQSDSSTECLDASGWRLEAAAGDFCLGQDISFDFAFPPRRLDGGQNPLDLELGVFSLLPSAYGDPLRPPLASAQGCYPPCDASPDACKLCYQRVCATANCSAMGRVTLNNDGAEGLRAPSVPGSFRACFFANHASFVGRIPEFCGEPFRVRAAEVDECGVCGGDGASCTGCDDVPNSGKEPDECGICGGDGKSCAGCDDVPNSGKEPDECGICGGDGTSCAGCDDVPNSGAAYDSCGHCAKPGEGFMHCRDPYTLTFEGGCLGPAVEDAKAVVAWTAPSNRSSLRLEIRSNFPCELPWDALDQPASSFPIPPEPCADQSHPVPGCISGESSFRLVDKVVEALDECRAGEDSSSSHGGLVMQLRIDASRTVLAELALVFLPACPACPGGRPYIGSLGDTCPPYTPPAPGPPPPPAPPPPAPPPPAAMEWVETAVALSLSASRALEAVLPARRAARAALAAEWGEVVELEQIRVTQVCAGDGSTCSPIPAGVVRALAPAESGRSARTEPKQRQDTDGAVLSPRRALTSSILVFEVGLLAAAVASAVAVLRSESFSTALAQQLGEELMMVVDGKPVPVPVPGPVADASLLLVGLVGGLVGLLLIGCIAAVLRKRRRRAALYCERAESMKRAGALTSALTAPGAFSASPTAQTSRVSAFQDLEGLGSPGYGVAIAQTADTPRQAPPQPQGWVAEAETRLEEGMGVGSIGARMRAMLPVIEISEGKRSTDVGVTVPGQQRTQNKGPASGAGAREDAASAEGLERWEGPDGGEGGAGGGEAGGWAAEVAVGARSANASGDGGGTQTWRGRGAPDARGATGEEGGGGVVARLLGWGAKGLSASQSRKGSKAAPKRQLLEQARSAAPRRTARRGAPGSGDNKERAAQIGAPEAAATGPGDGAAGLAMRVPETPVGGRAAADDPLADLFGPQAPPEASVVAPSSRGTDSPAVSAPPDGADALGWPAAPAPRPRPGNPWGSAQVSTGEGLLTEAGAGGAIHISLPPTKNGARGGGRSAAAAGRAMMSPRAAGAAGRPAASLSLGFDQGSQGFGFEAEPAGAFASDPTALVDAGPFPQAAGAARHVPHAGYGNAGQLAGQPAAGELPREAGRPASRARQALLPTLLPPPSPATGSLLSHTRPPLPVIPPATSPPIPSPSLSLLPPRSPASPQKQSGLAMDALLGPPPPGSARGQAFGPAIAGGESREQAVAQPSPKTVETQPFWPEAEPQGASRAPRRTPSKNPWDAPYLADDGLLGDSSASDSLDPLSSLSRPPASLVAPQLHFSQHLASETHGAVTRALSPSALPKRASNVELEPLPSLGMPGEELLPGMQRPPDHQVHGERHPQAAVVSAGADVDLDELFGSKPVTAPGRIDHTAATSPGGAAGVSTERSGPLASVPEEGAASPGAWSASMHGRGASEGTGDSSSGGRGESLVVGPMVGIIKIGIGGSASKSTAGAPGRHVPPRRNVMGGLSPGEKKVSAGGFSEGDTRFDATAASEVRARTMEGFGSAPGGRGVGGPTLGKLLSPIAGAMSIVGRAGASARGGSEAEPRDKAGMSDLVSIGQVERQQARARARARSGTGEWRYLSVLDTPELICLVDLQTDPARPRAHCQAVPTFINPSNTPCECAASPRRPHRAGTARACTAAKTYTGGSLGRFRLRLPRGGAQVPSPSLYSPVAQPDSALAAQALIPARFLGLPQIHCCRHGHAEWHLSRAAAARHHLVPDLPQQPPRA